MVLAGGASRRMGRDKASLPLGGETLLVAAIRKLRRAQFAVLVSGVRTAEETDEAACLPDRFEGCGPLAGIEAGLDAAIGGADAENRQVLFLAVDVPSVPEYFLAALWERAESTGALATIPLEAGFPQPLCAVYSRELQPGLRAALEHGERRVLPAIAQLSGAHVIDLFSAEAVAASRGWTGTHRWFQNVNTPDEYEHLQRLGFASQG